MENFEDGMGLIKLNLTSRVNGYVTMSVFVLFPVFVCVCVVYVKTVGFAALKNYKTLDIDKINFWI